MFVKGLEPTEKAVVDQWLEYKVCQVDRSVADKDIDTFLKVHLLISLKMTVVIMQDFPLGFL